MNAERGPSRSTGDATDIIVDDRSLCVRTNIMRMLNGDAGSKALLDEITEPNDDTHARIKCPVSVCGAIVELNLEDGSYDRYGDCAVVMAGVLNIIDQHRTSI